MLSSDDQDDIRNQEIKNQEFKREESRHAAETCQLLLVKSDFSGAEKGNTFPIHECDVVLDTFLGSNQTDPVMYRMRAECRLKLGKYIQALHDME